MINFALLYLTIICQQLYLESFNNWIISFHFHFQLNCFLPKGFKLKWHIKWKWDIIIGSSTLFFFYTEYCIWSGFCHIWMYNIGNNSIDRMKWSSMLLIRIILQLDMSEWWKLVYDIKPTNCNKPCLSMSAVYVFGVNFFGEKLERFEDVSKN